MVKNYQLADSEEIKPLCNSVKSTTSQSTLNTLSKFLNIFEICKYGEIKISSITSGLKKKSLEKSIYFEINENKKTFQNLWDTDKTVYKGRFIEGNAHI